jgi:hypothetical protein
VVEELFRAAAPAKVPMRAWLVRDLMTDFDVEVWAHVWGDTGVKAFVSRPPTLTPVPKGQRPKGDAEHLRRNVTWFYRARIATPNVMIETLAEEYREEAAQTGRSLGFRDATGVADRPDTKLVRHGVADAERLLSLTIPPELWTEFRTIH